MHNIFIIILLFTVPVFSSTKTFVYCSEGSPSTFNPQLAVDGTTFNVTKTFYNRLVEFKYGETEVLPALAESWSVSPNGLTFTFKLRKNVKFHTTEYFTPTRNFNADDVVFSFTRQMDKNNPYNKVGGGSYEYFASMDMQNTIKSVTKKDEFTVVFELSKPEAPFLANLAMDFASILSKEYADKLLADNKKEDLDNLPVGTGPFVFKKYIKDTLIRFEAHPQYFLGKAKIDKLVFAITPDASVRYQKLKAGECHFVAYPAPADLENMRKDPKFKLVDKSGLNIGYLTMNVEKKPFDNPVVRKAISHALNKKSYIKAIYMDQAMLASNPIQLVNKHFGSERAIIAGNSVSHDKKFLEYHFKDLSKKLHYRLLDVSSWKIIMQNLYNVKYDKKNTHRALDDIRESIGELKYYMSFVQTP